MNEIDYLDLKNFFRESVGLLNNDKQNNGNEKPPLGLLPKRLVQEKRFLDVCDAICRYYNADMKIPVEWIEEYNELIDILDGD